MPALSASADVRRAPHAPGCCRPARRTRASDQIFEAVAQLDALASVTSLLAWPKTRLSVPFGYAVGRMKGA